MRAIRALIVDDEPPARAKLRDLLALETDMEVCGEAADGDTAIRLVVELRPDLLFLDVQMPPPDGLAVLQAVREDWLPVTIFVTAYAEHAVEAFRLHALDYLLKPYTRDRFGAALERVRQTLATRRVAARQAVNALLAVPKAGPGMVERFLVKTNDRYLVVRTVDITWVEAAANYVVLHTPSGNHMLRRTLGMIETELDPRRFFRTSRSAIVALDAVRELKFLTPGEYVIILRDGTRVPLTRGLREFQDRL